jgi:ribosome-associated protein
VGKYRDALCQHDAVTTVAIRTDYIGLGQLLQYAGLVETGGQAKAVLAADRVRVNGEPEARRGWKVRPGDVVEVTGHEAFEVVAE